MMQQMEKFLENGVDVPIIIVENQRTRDDSGRVVAHALLATHVRGPSGKREFLVTDPCNGTTEWISAAALKDGKTNFFAGDGGLCRVYLSILNHRSTESEASQ